MQLDQISPVDILLDGSSEATAQFFSRAVRLELRGLPKPSYIRGVPYPVSILISSGGRLGKDAVRALAACAEYQTGVAGLTDSLYNHFFPA
jgi:hypothetical protein